MTPNTEQIQSIIRWLLTLSGPIAVYLAARGVTVDAITQAVSSVIAIISLVPPIISLIWGVLSHTEAAKIKAVEELPDVKKIVSVANPTKDGAVAQAIISEKQPKVVQG